MKMLYPSDPNRPEIAMGSRARQSPYFERIRERGACMYSVYNHMLMATSYGDPEREYDLLMNHAAIWDVGCERQVQLEGPDAVKLAQLMSPRDVSKCKIGQGFYTPILARDGGVINDPILLKLSEQLIWLSIADSDVKLYARGLADAFGLDVEVTEPDVSPLAIQGPRAEDVVASVFGDEIRAIRYFYFIETDIEGIPVVLQRSGWSKQGGFEIYLRDGAQGGALYDLMYAAGERLLGENWGPGTPNPVERIESGLFSWGTDFDERNNPYECRLGKWVDLDGEHDFLAKEALLKIRKEGPRQQLVGLEMQGEEPRPGVIKPMKVTRADGTETGTLQASTWSPRLGKNIGLGRVLTEDSALGTALVLHIAGEDIEARVVDVPFV